MNEGASGGRSCGNIERILKVQGLVKLYHSHPEEFCVPRDSSGDFLNAQAQAQQARAQDVRKIGLALPSFTIGHAF